VNPVGRGVSVLLLMNRSTDMEKPLISCQTTSPEDLSEGDYVTVLRQICEVPSFFWPMLETRDQPPERPVRYEQTPCDAGIPLRIDSICLPFLFVRRPNGTYTTLDLRRMELTRLPRKYAERVTEKMTRETTKASRA
jgi:hypothetical protein